MAKEEEPQGIQCVNVDIELLRRQLARLETMITDKFSEVRDLIENASAQTPVFPPSPEPAEPLPVEVNLHDNLARREDISNMIGIIKTLNGTVSLVVQGLTELYTVFKAMPKSDEIVQSSAITAVNRLGNEYLGKITDKIDSGLSKSYTNGQSKATAKSEKQAQRPHEKKSRLTPGEIEAIKAMRANPHIPEDARPPLPEVYLYPSIKANRTPGRLLFAFLVD